MRVVFCTKSEILAQNFAAVYPSIVVRIGDAILDIVERELSDNGDEVGVCIITDGIMLKNVEMLDSVVAHMQALDCEYASDSDNMILYVRDVPKCRRYFSVATCNKIKKTINMPKLLENEYLNYLRTRLDYRSITTMSDYFIKMPPTNKIAFLRENALWRIENHCDILNCNTAELPVPELPVPE